MNSLADRKCSACLTAKRPLSQAEFEPFLEQISGWTIIDNHRLFKSIKTRSFAKSMELANAIGTLADAENHHPDLLVRWGELKIEVWTHKVNGLTEADFVLAAKIDQLTEKPMLTDHGELYQSRKAIEELQPFPEALTDRYSAIRLDFNENTLGLRHLQLDGFSSHHTTAYPQYGELVERLAALYQVQCGQIMLSCGSDEALPSICTTLIEPGKDCAVIAAPTFSVIKQGLILAGARLIEVPVKNCFSFDEDALEAAIASHHPKLVILANPDNPTGALLTNGKIEHWTAKFPRTLFLIDEAYFEYTNQTALPLLPQRKNLMITRTFSKAWGLAGMRVGVTISNTNLIQLLKRPRLPFCISSLAAEVVARACSFEAEVRKQAEDTMERKKHFITSLRERGFGLIEGNANFYLLRAGSSADQLCEHLKRQHILVRNLSRGVPAGTPLHGFLRIAVGTNDENSALLAGLDSFSEVLC